MHKFDMILFLSLTKWNTTLIGQAVCNSGNPICSRTTKGYIATLPVKHGKASFFLKPGNPGKSQSSCKSNLKKMIFLFLVF